MIALGTPLVTMSDLWACSGEDGMAAAGMTGETAEEVMRQLGEMEATMVSNGLVVEVIGRCGYAVQAALTSALARHLGIQEQYVTSTLGDRFRCV